MAVDQTLYRLFRGGSRTYFFSSIFFPPAVREEVFALYGFVRKADNFVDSVPQDGAGFRAFRTLWKSGFESQRSTGDVVIDSFNALARKRNFERPWIEAFLDAMEQDLSVGDYQTLDQCVGYMYGSAEVVGLMMARLLGLPEESLPAAQMLGRAMQYINFIRDIDEDIRLGRTYLPHSDRQQFGLEKLDFSAVSARPKQFSEFIAAQVSRYQGWQVTAEAGFHFLPRRYRIPVATASEMYKWTAKVISRDPFILYKKKVRPGVPRIVIGAGYQALTC